MLLTLDQLEVLDAIARLGSFSAAAQELHRATSAVSYANKTLESSLGVSVFDRSGHRAKLTESGRLVGPYRLCLQLSCTTPSGTLNCLVTLNESVENFDYQSPPGSF